MVFKQILTAIAWVACIVITAIMLFSCDSSNNGTYQGPAKKEIKMVVTRVNGQNVKSSATYDGNSAKLVGYTPGGFPIYSFEYEGNKFIIVGHDAIVQVK